MIGALGYAASMTAVRQLVWHMHSLSRATVLVMKQ